jgi:hypothetical protein
MAQNVRDRLKVIALITLLAIIAVSAFQSLDSNNMSPMAPGPYEMKPIWGADSGFIIPMESDDLGIAAHMTVEDDGIYANLEPSEQNNKPPA